ncbi:hypothetical protein [Pseudomonas sp. S9]|uniref:hypothetical protein n=1 Tax=Pseudomonas sp. S9 TaxID=686578 RepID=UPI00025572EA|nr:hypothetical protein [Pseudomonas sp. S9]
MEIKIYHRSTKVEHTMFIVDELFQLINLVFGSEQAAIAYFRRQAKSLLDSRFKGSLSDAVSKQAALDMLALQVEGFKHSSPITEALVQHVLDAFAALFTVPLHVSEGVHE